MKPTTFDPTKTSKTSAAETKAAGTFNRSKARFFEEKTPERNGKRSDENSRQPEPEAAMGNSELKLEESDEELLKQLGLLEPIELTPEEDAALMLELEQLEQAEKNSTEQTSEELNLEIELIEQNLKKQDEEKISQRRLEKAEKKLAQNERNFNPLLIGDIETKKGAVAEEELGEERPVIENRNRTSLFTRIGNMTSISSFCRSLLTNRGGAAAEVELGEKEAHKQAWNKEQIESEPEKQKDRSDEESAERKLKLQQAREAEAAREIRRNLSKDLRKIEEKKAEANKESEEKIKALRAKQLAVKRPSNTLVRGKTTASKTSPNSRPGPKK
jgi:hypothetical protein